MKEIRSEFCNFSFIFYLDVRDKLIKLYIFIATLYGIYAYEIIKLENMRILIK